MNIDSRKVAVYIRWSTDDQSEGTTLDVQTDGCKHYLLSQGWVFNENLLFIDDGYSGSNLDRPAMAKLRKAVNNGEVECVVVFKLDRLSRSVVDTVRLVLEEWDGICHVKSARDPIDTTTPMGKQFFYMLVSFAELERNVIKERTFSGKMRRANDGRNPGAPPPYGYRVGETTGSYVIHQEEADVVRHIFGEYARGVGFYQIASGLNARGIPTSRGKWSSSAISYLLGNMAYIGTLTYGVWRKNPRSKRGEVSRQKHEPSVTKEDAIPPIIEKSLWDACQRVRASRSGNIPNPAGRGTSSKHLLTTIMKCRCGRSFVGQLGKGKPYYVCDGYRRYGTEVCDCGYLHQSELDALVTDLVVRKLQGKVNQNLIRHNILGESQRQRARIEADVARIVSLIKDLEEQDKRNRKAFRLGETSGATYETVRSEIEEEKKAHHETLSELRLRLAGITPAPIDVEADFARFDAWHELSVPEKKQLLRGWVEKLIVYRKAHTQDPISSELAIRYIDTQ